MPRPRRCRHRAALAAAAAVCGRGGGVSATTPAAGPCWASTSAGVVNITLMQPASFMLRSHPDGWEYQWLFGWCAGAELPPAGEAPPCPPAFGAAAGRRALIYGAAARECEWAFQSVDTELRVTEEPGSGWAVAFRLRGTAPAGTPYPQSTDRHFDVTLHCDASAGARVVPHGATRERGVAQEGSGVPGAPFRYSAEFATGWACPGADLRPLPPGVVSATSAPWTAGSVFLTLLAGGAVLYLVLGSIYNYRIRELRGQQVIPHLEFWKDLPWLVWDGMLLARDRTRAALQPHRFDTV